MVQGSEGKEERGVVFERRTPKYEERGQSHIFWTARAVCMFSSNLRARWVEGTCSSNLDNKFVNCTEETPSGRFWATDAGARIKRSTGIRKSMCVRRRLTRSARWPMSLSRLCPMWLEIAGVNRHARPP